MAEENHRGAGRRRFSVAFLLLVLAAALVLGLRPFLRGIGGEGDGSEVLPAAEAGGHAAGLEEHDRGVEGIEAPPKGGKGPTRIPSRAPASSKRECRGRFRFPGGGPWIGGEAVLERGAPKVEGGVMKGLFLSGDRSAREAFRRWLSGRKAVARAPLAPDGGFVFGDPPSGDFELRLLHPLARLENPLRVRIPEDRSLDLGVIDALPGAGLVVLVLDPLGRPVRGASVELAPEIDLDAFMDPGKLEDFAGLFRSLVPRKKVTGSSGTAEFRDLEPGKGWKLGVEAEGFARVTRPVSPRAGERLRLSVRMTPGAVLELRIEDASGAGIAKAQVSLPEEEKNETGFGGPGTMSFGVGRERRKVWADAEGRARLGGLPGGCLRFEVEKNGYLPFRGETSLLPGERRLERIVLDEGGRIRGRVLDAEGRPVPGAAVMDLGPFARKFMGMDLAGQVGLDLIAGMAAAKGFRCDRDGRFEIRGLEKGAEISLLAVAEGFAPGRSGPFREGETDAVLRLERASTIEGRVLAAENGEALEVFRIEVATRAWMVLERPLATRRFEGAKDGRFRLEGLTGGRVVLKLRAQGRAELRREIVLKPGRIDLGDLRLEPPAEVRGIVVDRTGRPVPGALVRPSRGGTADNPVLARMLGGEGPKAETTDEGAFRLTGLPARRFRLLATKEGFAPSRSGILRVRPGRITEGVRIVLGRGGRIAGRIEDGEGKPLEGWRIQVDAQDQSLTRYAVSGADGSFRVEALKPGHYRCAAFPKGLAGKVLRESGKTERAGRGGRSPDFTAQMKSILKFTVQDRAVIRDGETTELRLVYRGESPAVGTKVRGCVRLAGVPLDSGIAELGARTGAGTPTITEVRNGDFDFGAVPPGAYRLKIRRGLLGGFLGTPKVVEIPEKASFRIDLDLPGGVLAGRVLGSGGDDPVPSVLLALVPEEQGGTGNLDLWFGEGQVLSDGEGRFRFEGLKAGRYEIHAREFGPGGSPRTGRLEGLVLGEGEVREGLELRLRGGGRLRVSVRKDGRVLPGALVRILDARGNPFDAFHRGVTDASGVFELSNLAPGEYRAGADAEEAAPARSGVFRIFEGGEERIDLDLESGRPVYLLLGKGAPRIPPNEVLVFVIRGPDGSILRHGALPAAFAGGRIAEGGLPLGRLAPGRYRLEIECTTLGKRRLEESVPERGEARWVLEGPR